MKHDDHSDSNELAVIIAITTIDEGTFTIGKLLKLETILQGVGNWKKDCEC